MDDKGVLKSHDRKEKFPPGFHNAYLFAVFNAFSFQIILNSPMIIYAKTLGASATELGIITGMMPLLVIFQIPAAQYIHKVGYRRFVYSGWGTRVAFIFLMALVPLTSGFLTPRARLSLMLLFLFGFNLSRGISSAAWLPWIASLVPEKFRGKYLVRDAACVNIASCITFVLCALLLGNEPQQWQFSILFIFSATMGALSLVFLKRMPDVEVPSPPRTAKIPVPWKEIFSHSPFKKLLLTAMVWSVVYGGMSAFAVAFMKSDIGLPADKILLITAVSFLGGLSSLWFLGHRLDSFGSKPVILFSMILWLAMLFGWMTISGRYIAGTMELLIILQFIMGLSSALINMANTRLAMATIPVMGRDHFFAMYSVLSCLTQGLAPVGWGVLIDAFGDKQLYWAGLQWNRFTVFFALAALTLLVSMFLAKKLHEPQAANMEDLLREILVQSPQRVWLRLWPRN